MFFVVVFGVGEQFVGSFGVVIFQLFGGQCVGGLLVGQFGDLFLIKCDVQGGMVFFGLGVMVMQQWNQQECQGCQQQQVGSELEIDYLLFFNRLVRCVCFLVDRVVCILVVVCWWCRMIMLIISMLNSSKVFGLNQSSQVCLLIGGLQ